VATAHVPAIGVTTIKAQVADTTTTLLLLPQLDANILYVLLATETAVDSSVQGVSVAPVMLLDLISAISVQSEEPWAVPTPRGPTAVILLGTVAYKQATMVEILVLDYTQEHLVIHGSDMT
jgi:hypothetical protein